MAEYFEDSEEAEAYLMRTHNSVALYARIRLNDSEKWMVDHQERDRGSLITVLENLTNTVPKIRSRRP